ncbi:SAM-dependent methyltransferase [Methylohalomonas lacus]|uniref:SAM-dependent methyltransferase n=2 Tax=Methylohalomonas lacus TaxID=398773 RepID=A0AAE3L601_9GAMM|nr:SAM-dependent methyltransferase [Methylohalomonas lacus]
MLHFAPERCLVPYFESIPSLEYETADLNGKKAHLVIDVTDIPLPDRSFDLVYCSHVLEHVNDDITAMSELYRILKPGGSAVILVPIIDAATYEDPDITDPNERARLFGQHDHVRRYGLDIVTRLSAAGFNVQLFSITDIAGEDEIEIMGLDCPGCREIFLCSKH